VIPCLLLKEKGLVKTTQFKNPVYLGDPINAVKIFNEKETDELIFLDITATFENRTVHLDVVRQIGDECFMPFAVGGGIKTIETVKKIFVAGAEKVVLNSHAIENPDFLSEAAQRFGSQSIVVSLDVRQKLFGKYEVFINAGKKGARLDPVKAAKLMEAKGAGELLINSINKEGTGKGYDMELIKTVSEAVNIPVIASGGAGKLEHFRNVVEKSGASAVAAGSMFVFHGQRKAVLINYPTKQELHNLFGH
jgi:cyclase